jgi:hypothetical protein
MAGFAGFDIWGFPNQPMTDWLRANTNLVWCGFYPGQQFSGAHSSPIANGLQGTTDGAQAANPTAQAGFPSHSCVYPDLEDGPPLSAPRTDYGAARVTAVKAGLYRSGDHCSHAIAANVQTLCGAIPIWAFKVPTTDQTIISGTQFPDPGAPPSAAV